MDKEFFKIKKTNFPKCKEEVLFSDGLNSSDDKNIFVIAFLGGILAGFLIILILMKLTGYGKEEDGSEFNKALEVKELADKNKEFSVRGHSFKTVTVCLEGKEMLFAFYRGEPQIVNLNKNCRETK